MFIEVLFLRMRLIVICLLLIYGCAPKFDPKVYARKNRILYEKKKPDPIEVTIVEKKKPDVSTEHSEDWCLDRCEKYLRTAEILFNSGDYTCVDDPHNICILDCLDKPRYVRPPNGTLGYFDSTYCYQDLALDGSIPYDSLRMNMRKFGDPTKDD